MRPLFLSVSISVLVSSHGVGQAADTLDARSAAFLAQARMATARFKDQNIAIAENYVKIGPDFPAMGEHWVRGESIMRSDDTPLPSILTYVNVDGKPMLTGVVYTLVLRSGQKPPAMPPAAQWHEHVGTIDEESLLFGHDHLPTMTGGDEPRLSVMHAWAWVPNPAGPFATDNWALPFTRVGLVAPPVVSINAARALSVVSSASYYSRLFEAVGQLDDRESDAVFDVIDRARVAAQDWLDRRRAGAVSTADVSRLEAIWSKLGDEIVKAVRPESAARLRHVL
jgi:hypothetical protein